MEWKRDALVGFAPVTEALLAKRTLLRRTDSKFVFGAGQLDRILAPLSEHYAILHANDKQVATYKTLYFDTPQLRCFHDHRRGCRPRHKVRVRHYPDREVTFLEIKTKRNEFVTNKRRKPHPYGNTELGELERSFIQHHSGLPASALVPQLWTNFDRLTLVGIRTAERITIDTNLELVHGGHSAHLGGVTIMEVKQSPFTMRTPAMTALRQAGHRPVSASKYCTASALLRSGLRVNRLLPAVRMIERLRT